MCNLMDVSITYISSDRFYGKAYRACYDEVKQLETTLASSLSDLSGRTKIEVWVVDQPADFIDIISLENRVMEIHVGRDVNLDLRPMSENCNEAFVASIKPSISLVSKTLNSYFNALKQKT